MANEETSKRRIMEHLAKSSGNFFKISQNSDARKRQIMEHIRQTKGE